MSFPTCRTSSLPASHFLEQPPTVEHVGAAFGPTDSLLFSPYTTPALPLSSGAYTILPEIPVTSHTEGAGPPAAAVLQKTDILATDMGATHADQEQLFIYQAYERVEPPSCVSAIPGSFYQRPPPHRPAFNRDLPLPPVQLPSLPYDPALPPLDFCAPAEDNPLLDHHGLAIGWTVEPGVSDFFESTICPEEACSISSEVVGTKRKRSHSAEPVERGQKAGHPAEQPVVVHVRGDGRRSKRVRL